MSQKLAAAKKNQSVIEKYLLNHASWNEGFREFSRLMNRPDFWIYIAPASSESKLIPLDRKGAASSLTALKQDKASTAQFLKKFADQWLESSEMRNPLPAFFRTNRSRMGLMLGLSHLGNYKGFIFLTEFSSGNEIRVRRDLEPYLKPFQFFAQAHLEIAYKNFELNNFYETVHPRALALSTMHSVHRVISASLRLKDLLPRIGRLSAQILKAQGCSILLMDADGQHLTPFFALGTHKRYVHHHRVRVGRGVEGRIADTGEFRLSPSCIGVPFIEHDVVGVIMLWDKVDGQAFSATDLEILKSLSEQAVVAIKNAQLYERTEELTMGSIRTITGLLERQFGKDRSHLELVAEISLEVGRQMGLRGTDIVNLERGILLLDAGQLVHPELTLEKKERLSKKEFQALRSLPIKAANLLKSISSLKPALPIILYRHERFDGRGYPEGLKGEQIPIGARIVSVVDSFTAMLSKRHYRRPKTVQEALHEIETHKNTQFDPQVVDTFLKVVKNDAILSRIQNLALRAGSEIRLPVSAKSLE